jgi:hypothetical protein
LVRSSAETHFLALRRIGSYAVVQTILSSSGARRWIGNCNGVMP